MHPIIIQRCVMTRMWPKPWGNPLWTWHNDTITLMWVRIRLLTRCWRWLGTFSFIWSFLLLLDNFLFLGQEFLKTRPFFFLIVFGIFLELPERPVRSIFRPVRPIFVDSSFFLLLPPSVEFFNETSRNFFAGTSWRDFESSDISSPIIIFFLFADFGLIWPN